MASEIDRYSNLVELSPTGCLLLEDGVVRRANADAVETMGIPSGRLLGVPLRELLVPEFESACDDLITGAADETRIEPVRLARGLAPLELAARRLEDGIVLVNVRSMANEHYYSAIAGGALTHDLVTGFPNHYHVLSQLEHRMSSQKSKSIALLCLWIDDLPELADTHGKRAVQRIVKEVGNRIQSRLRSPDMVGRFDETGFLVLMNSDAPPKQLTEIADRLRGEVSFPVEIDRDLVSFTASVVVGSIVGQNPSVERVLALLEAAAHRAAQSGGNRVDVLAI